VLTATASGPGQHDLLRGGSELIDLSMLAARASGAARRASAGGTIDDQDRDVFLKLGSLLEAAAESVDFFGSGGQQGSPPSGALAASVDAAIEAVLDEGSRRIEEADLATALHSLSRRVKELSAGHPQDAVDLSEFFAELAASVLRQSGHVGEVATSL
jgi:hypothetical protein